MQEIVKNLHFLYKIIIRSMVLFHTHSEMLNRDKYYKPKGTSKYSLNKYNLPTGLASNMVKKTEENIVKDFNSEENIDNSDVSSDGSQQGE